MNPRKESLADPARSRAGVRTGLIVLASVVTCVFGLAGTAQAGGQYVEVKYAASAAADELQVAVTYTMWIPDGVPRLRGVIVHQHGAGTTASKEGSTAAYDLHWQALAKKWDCALLGPSYHVLHERNDLSPGSSQLWFDPRRGSEKSFLKALRDLGAKSDHPELETVPWALWGHSGGGIWADVMNTMHPDRIAAMWLRSGSVAQFRTHDEFPQPQVPAAAYAIPIMLNPGVKEEATFKPNPKGKEKGPWFGNLATFHEYRAADGTFLDQWRNIVVPCAFWMTKDDELWVCGSSPMPWRADDKVLGYPPVDQLFMKFNTSGKLLQLWSVPLGEDGKERPGDLNWAHGIAVDSKGNIYAVDIKGKRAQKFVLQESPPQKRPEIGVGLKSKPSEISAPPKAPPPQTPPAQPSSRPGGYSFDGKMSRQVLEREVLKAKVENNSARAARGQRRQADKEEICSTEANRNDEKLRIANWRRHW
jgi:pimeloyl-ACP methyl ester carboxylesterase